MALYADLQHLSIKSATRKVAGQSPAMGFIFLFVAGLKANCCNLKFNGNYILDDYIIFAQI